MYGCRLPLELNWWMALLVSQASWMDARVALITSKSMEETIWENESKYPKVRGTSHSVQMLHHSIIERQPKIYKYFSHNLHYSHYIWLWRTHIFHCGIACSAKFIHFVFEMFMQYASTPLLPFFSPRHHRWDCQCNMWSYFMLRKTPRKKRIG